MNEKASDADIPSYTRPTDVDRRSTFLQRMQWRLESAAWYGLYWDRFKAMDIEKAARHGADIIGWFGPRFAKSAHRTATRNIKLAFPDLDEEARVALLKDTWRSFGQLAGELPHLPKISEFGDDPRLTVIGGEHLDNLRETGQAAVLISGHFSNWEVMVPPIAARLPDAEITYRSVNNPHIDACIARIRHENGAANLAAKGNSTRGLMRALAHKRAVALLNDQKFREGVAVPLFGHPAMTAPGPTRLAMRFKAPLVPFSCQRTGLARYQVTIHEPFHPASSGTDDENIYNTLLRINQFVENQVREAPDQWFWQHNRWPKEAWAKAGVI